MSYAFFCLLASNNFRGQEEVFNLLFGEGGFVGGVSNHGESQTKQSDNNLSAPREFTYVHRGPPSPFFSCETPWFEIWISERNRTETVLLNRWSNNEGMPPSERDLTYQSAIRQSVRKSASR